ncbi:hypothetical protein BJY01DRAFT_253476 [Aspergillus pseudoustus]|uniref:Tryptophan dimethylallyltransferase-domain-containing protein n=1 Tax=Aspergillus pseudoustus TaxID=1810923 RepID=A0ABR4J0D8_9EURO
MPLPMQVSLPLALHLRSPVTFDIFSNQHWKPGEKFDNGRTLNDFGFLDQRSGRGKATLLFAAILRAIFNHPDWAQLHAFFSTRYNEKSKDKMVKQSEKNIDPASRTLHPFDKDNLYSHHKPTIVDFRTDPESVNLPPDLASLLATAGRTSRSGMLGPDPQPAAIGPAISAAFGAGAYMDLVYAGHPPGEYPELSWIAGQLYGWRDEKFQPLTQALGDATSKKGGRGRYWAEWAALWKVIAEWVYEHDSTALQLGFLGSHSYKYRLSEAEDRSFNHFGKIPRAYLATDAINAADAIRDVFAQLAAEPVLFQGIEWSYLEMDVPAGVREAFYKRFGTAGKSDPSNRYAELLRGAGRGGSSSLVYDEVSPMALRPCPAKFRGAAWEAWLLSIEGGDVVVVETLFQALWAITLLSQLPLDIHIMEEGERFPKYRDPMEVYM